MKLTLKELETMTEVELNKLVNDNYTSDKSISYNGLTYRVNTKYTSNKTSNKLHAIYHFINN